jgi:hypothetical protein
MFEAAKDGRMPGPKKGPKTISSSAPLAAWPGT